MSKRNTSSASWSARSTSRILDQLAQPVLSNCGSVIPAGMPNVVLAVLPMHVVAPAGSLPFPVEDEAVAAAFGTAVGVVDCMDIFEMVSVAKEL